jgi:hypothetical protein
MPDSDPSSTSSAPSSSDLSADSDGDGCRWRTLRRTDVTSDIAAFKAALFISIAEFDYRLLAAGVIRLSYFHRKRSGPVNVAALQH